MESKKRQIAIQIAMMNKVMVIGHLTQDAEVTFKESSYGNEPIQITNFTVAVDGAANYGQETAFIDFSKIGDFPVAKHLLTGKLVYVEGQISQQRKEIDGQMKVSTNFQCERITLMPSTKKEEEEGTDDYSLDAFEERAADLPTPARPTQNLKKVPAPGLKKPPTPPSFLLQKIEDYYGTISSLDQQMLVGIINWVSAEAGIVPPKGTVTLQALEIAISSLSVEAEDTLLAQLKGK